MRIICTAILSIIWFSKGNAAKPDSSLFLIPQPKIIEYRNGIYDFGNSYFLGYYGTETFAAELLKNTIVKKYRVNPVDSVSGSNQIMLIRANGDRYNDQLKTENISLPFDLGEEGYAISITPRSILIVAKENAGLFYGVQTLIQVIGANSTGRTIPCMAIYDKPDIQMRGWQDDISRGPIPTMDFLKEEIRRMSSFKLNTFTLYTEHTFKLRKHPGIAPLDGITEEEIKELTAFAERYHVEIIGNFQSFGHFKNILKHPGYENLAENESNLSPSKEESYKFLQDVYSEIAPAYKCKYFHINCDEVSLGQGPSKSSIDSIGIEGVYVNHIKRIQNLLKPYGKSIMIWGDMAIKNPKIIDLLPKDVIIATWGYADMESMDEDILPFKNAGFEFIVAPGVNCWSRIYPDLGRATINIYNFLRDGFKNNALGFINTTWDDDGQNLFNNNWYSLCWGADCGWNAPLNEPAADSEKTRKSRVSSFKRSYNKIYFETDHDVTSLLFGVSDLRTGPVKNCLSNSSLWNPILPDYNIIPENYRSDNLYLIKTIDSLYNEINKLKLFDINNKEELELLQFALRQAKLVAQKNLLGIRMKNYINDNIPGNRSYFKKDFAKLNDSIKTLKNTYGNLWSLENRNWWLDTVYSYYDSFDRNLEDLKGVCIFKASDKLLNGKREIQLRSAFNDLPVYYTTAGTSPDQNSTKYTQPIYTNQDIRIRARVIENFRSGSPPSAETQNARMFEVQSDSLIFHKGIGKLFKLNSKWNGDNPAYAARGEFGLIDGRRGSKTSFNDGRWQAYFGNDIDIELDFGEAVPLSKITMGFAQLMRYGILFPKEIEISTSTDGHSYSLIKTTENAIDPNTLERSTHDYIIPLENIHSRYIKIVAKNTGTLPEWHYAKGKTAWLYADEIIIE